MNQNAIIYKEKVPLLIEFSEKPKILCVADFPKCSISNKCFEYRKYLPQYDIDIGYSLFDEDNKKEYWEEKLKNTKYDLICFFSNFLDSSFLKSFVFSKNKFGTQVVLTHNEFVSTETILQNLKSNSIFNALSVSDQKTFDNFEKSGFHVYRTFGGVDLNVFGHHIPVQKRPLKILFSSYKKNLDENNYSIWREVKLLLKEEDIQFEELVVDFSEIEKEQINDICNQCQIFIHLSEHTPCSLLEAASCGLVPITNKTGCYNYFSNLFVVENNALDVSRRIIFLKKNPELLIKMSRSISKEVLPWDNKFMSQHWGYFIQQVLIKKKGIYFL